MHPADPSSGDVCICCVSGSLKHNKQPENEKLKKRNAELEAEITELKARVAELEAKLLATLV